MEKSIRIERKALTEFCAKVFECAGIDWEDALLSSTVLVEADARGIPSHGVARMIRYIRGIETGVIIPNAKETILRETPTSLAVDANAGMGFPVSRRTMETVIEKAENCGMAWGVVRNSNHFGIAGYYAMMALPHDMIGICMTNTAALGVPTFGRTVMCGTNPIAFAAPAGKERPFVLDMATTTVPRGKLEVYDRLNKPLPDGWAVDATGHPASDARQVLDDMMNRRGGGLLPLGGFGELFSGHKGYGLSMMVDIMCGMLSNGKTSPDVYDFPEAGGIVHHSFGAFKLSAFLEPAKFKSDMDELIRKLKETPRAEGCERVFVAGEKEFEAEDFNNLHGIPVDQKCHDNLDKLAEKYSIQRVAVL
jgi:LDH2 family malate/lactate/ureidoglycolate dehydrogenase